jgi:hypothetical protein
MMTGALKPMSSNHFKRVLVIGGVLIAGCVASLLAVRARAAGIPAANALTYTGYLETPAGDPVVSKVNVGVGVWSAATAGTKVCEAAAENLTPTAGRFQLVLPETCSAAVSANPNLWVEVAVDGASLGRTKLGAVPFAIEANHATSADSATNADSAGKADSATNADAAAKAASASGQLATDLTQMKADIAKLQGRLDSPLAISPTKYFNDVLLINTTTWTWVSGIDPLTLKPGRYWIFNTARFYGVATGCTTGCTNSTLVRMAACLKTAAGLTIAAGQVIAEDLSAGSLSTPTATTAYFDIAADTPNAQLGMCAARYAATGLFDFNVGNVYSLMLAQPK